MCPVSNIRKEMKFHTFFAGFMKIFVDICPEFKLWDLRNMCLDKYYDKEHFQRLSFGPLGKLNSYFNQDFELYFLLLLLAIVIMADFS